MLKDLYGDGNGGPDAEKAAGDPRGCRRRPRRSQLSLQYNPDDHYGPSSGDEYATGQGASSRGDGLFTVDLKSTEWVQYSKDRTADVYPAYQLGWFPDYSDADNYLTPFFLTKNFLGNHFSDAEVEELILAAGGHAPTRPSVTQMIEDIQARVGELLSTVPLLQGAQVAVAGDRRRRRRPRRVVQVPLRPAHQVTRHQMMVGRLARAGLPTLSSSTRR